MKRMIFFLTMLIGMTISAQDDDFVLADFEDGIGFTQDEYGNDIGFVPWGDAAGNVVLDVVAAEDELALPEQDDDNNILSVSYVINSFGGFSHVLTDGTSWTPQDWTDYSTLEFWLYGADSGGVIMVELFDNRAADSTRDTAERWFYRLDDDFTGWQHFSIPFTYFQRRTDWQPDGAPNDQLDLTEVHGYAFSFPSGVGEQISYIDTVTLGHGEGNVLPIETPTPRPTVDPAIPTPTPEPYNYDGEWTLIWSDEFDAEEGTPIDAEFWTCELGGHGWGNNQLEYNTDRIENVVHDGEGNLTITAREEDYRGNAYTSARCNTNDKLEFTYGRVEARINLPEGQGIWPAFWMLGAEFPDVPWPDSGEIDIMEYIGKEPYSTHGTIHGPGYSGSGGVGISERLSEPVADDFHVFGIEWEPDTISWYVDDEVYFTMKAEFLPRRREWVYNHDFFIIINVAVGGNWPGSPDETTEFPQEMLIDWIRVYQRT